MHKRPQCIIEKLTKVRSKCHQTKLRVHTTYPIISVQK